MTSEKNDSREPENLTATHWSVVLEAGLAETSVRVAALERLCSKHWFPLYWYARRLGSAPEEAKDLTQSFFAVFLEKNYVARADRSRGRFRTFLLTSFKNFLTNEWKRWRTERRGGAWQSVSYEAEAAEERGIGVGREAALPDEEFDRAWAAAMLEQSLARLRGEYERAGKAELYESLKLRLWGEEEGGAYAELAAGLGMSEAALKMAVMRLRRRFRDAIRQEIEQTVVAPGDVEDEMRYLLSLLRI